MMLPRTSTPATRTIETQVNEIVVSFTEEQVRQAIMRQWGSHPVGPEEYTIPQNARLVVRVTEDANGIKNHFALTWDEPIK